jgi:quercetin 2,3-dioxygenase
MIKIRKGDERGRTKLKWLDSYHTFSFADYFDPKHMNFGTLRVINDDIVQPGRGFGTHPHKDMEIITYVLDGALEHKDSTGTGSTIRHGDVQRMTAGTGILHSEYNPSKTELVHLLQIWILPERTNLKPSYEERFFPIAERQGELCLVASRDGHDNSITINQDVNLYAGILNIEKKLTHKLEKGRSSWIQVARGAVSINGLQLEAGDGAAITDEESINIESLGSSEILLFDLKD